MKRYYVYKITFADESYYIGYRGSSQAANDDFLKKYYSSSKVVRQRIDNGEPYSGEILAEGMTQEVAYNLEQKTIYENFTDEKILNRVCHYGREGFGILSDAAKTVLSEKTLRRWQDPEYKKMLAEKQSKAWTKERRLEQSKRLKGRKRPEHGEKLKGRTLSEEHKQKLRKPKVESHGKNLSKALKGVPKSEEHKKKLSRPKPIVICRLCDRKPMAMGNYVNWLNRQLKAESAC